MTVIQQKHQGLLYLTVAGITISTVPIVAKLGMQQQVSPIELTAMRFALAASILWGYFAWSQPSVMRIDRRGLWRCGEAALINCVSTFTFFVALSFNDASLTMLLFSTMYIILTLGFGLLMDERLQPIDFWRLLIALGGIYLFMDVTIQATTLGIIATFVSILTYTLYVMFVDYRLRDYGSSTVTLYILSWMAVVLMTAYLIVGYRWPVLSINSWGVVFWIAIVATAISRLMLFTGVKYAGSKQAALFSPLDTLLTVFWAVLILSEQLSPIQWVGCGMVITSILLANVRK